MSLAKISPAFDQFLENFILYELTKDSLETTNYETKVNISSYIFPHFSLLSNGQNGCQKVCQTRD